MLGVAYVIEGSTLGGKFILARLPPALAPLRGTATGFLEGYGAATGERWRSFGGVVERAITTPEEVADAVAGARDAFGRMIDWLAQFEQADPARIAEAS
jgi:heme oxygenase